MKAVLKTSELSGAIQAVAPISPRNCTIAILSHLLLDAKDGRLSVSACDLDIESKVEVAADVEIEGSHCVPAHVFSDILKRLRPGGDVSLSFEEQRLVIRSGRTRLAIDVLNPADFPHLDRGETRASFAVEPTDIAELFGRASFAISTETARYYLCGIFLHVSDRGGARLTAVATDGHRLAYGDRPAPPGSESMPAIIVPRKMVGEILRVAGSAKENISIEVGTGKITASCEGTRLISKLIDGTFPGYAHITPTSNKHRFTFDATQCADAVQRVSSLRSERGHGVKFSFGDGRLAITLRGDSGEGSDEIEIDGDDRAEIGFQSRYILEMLSAMNAETCVIEIDDPGSPALFRPLGRGGEHYVLMPVRV